MRLRPAVAVALCAAFVGTAACGTHDAATETKPAAAIPSASGQVDASDATQAVPEVFSFTSTTLDGKKFEGASLAGKPTVLWFWAPWCATCAGMAGSVSDVADKYRSQVNVVGVAGLGDTKAMRGFVEELEVGGVTHLNDQAGAVWRRFKITEQSTYVLIDRTGRVTYTGFLDDLAFNEQVKALAA